MKRTIQWVFWIKWSGKQICTLNEWMNEWFPTSWKRNFPCDVTFVATVTSLLWTFNGNFRPYLMFMITYSFDLERQYSTNEWLLVKVYVQSTWLSVWLFPSPCCGVWSSRVRWMSSTTQFRCWVKRLSSRSWNSANEPSCFPVSTVHVSTKIFWYLNTLYLFF